VRAAASLGPLPGAGGAGASLLAQLADAAEAALSPEDAAAAAAAAQLAANKSGFLGGIANVLESTLEGIDGVLAAVHVPYSYGFSIIALTLLVKVVTFPLSKKQIESTTAMQALQPRVKDLQARGRSGRRTAGTPEKRPPTPPLCGPADAPRLPRAARRRGTPTTRSSCSARRRSCTRRLA
jgi:predicted lipid-binding transport protein (Tim44 family)